MPWRESHPIGVSILLALPLSGAFDCGGLDTSAWTSLRQSPGYHVLCLHPEDGQEEVCKISDGCETSPGAKVKVHSCWSGLRSDCVEFETTVPQRLVQFEEDLVARKPLSNPTRHKRIKSALEKKRSWQGLFAFYKVKSQRDVPVRIRKSKQLTGLVLVYEGGSFLWPGVEEGYARNITIKPSGAKDAPLDIQLYTKSLDPVVLEVSSFISQDECNHIIKGAEPHIRKSDVSHMDHDVGKPSSDWRTSSTYFMPSDHDRTVQLLDRRVSALTNTRVDQQEHVQVLRYGVTEKYAAHHDFFEPEMYKGNEDIMRMTKKGLFNRLMTVFFYLTTVEEGGHTNFPRAGGRGQPVNFEDCETGLSIDPVQGRIIIFYHQHPDSSYDELSLHGGCAVKKGTKWSANKWIWNKKMDYVQDHS